MSPSTVNTALTVLLASAYHSSAQFLSGSRIASLVLTEQAAINSNISCGRYLNAPIEQTLAVQIFGNYTKTCYNVAETLSVDSYDNGTLSYDEANGTVSTCWPLNPNCTSQINVIGLDRYSPTANYSQVQVDILFAEFGASLREFEVRLFAGEACEEDGPEPWYSWGGCTESPQNDSSSSCREMPYSVKSFRLERNSSATSGGTCMVAAEYGAGVRMSKASVGAVFGGVFVAGLLALVT